ncbi:MAG: SoxR reducing system RseC family protein [Candidatus Marinimicrobia bacterium]|nr:SoxR reducing system RseC family protein [Candidatus Neomarinimicrobiota bacterium]
MNPEPRRIPEPEADYGEVIELKDDLAIVQMQTSDSCHSCRARIICQPNSTGQRILYVKNTLGAKIGDKVNLEQSGVNQIKLIFMQYGVPLLSFLVVIIVANRFITEKSNGIPPEVMQLIVALVFMILSGVVTYLWSKRKATQNFSIFRMKSIERE